MYFVKAWQRRPEQGKAGKKARCRKKRAKYGETARKVPHGYHRAAKEIGPGTGSAACQDGGFLRQNTVFLNVFGMQSFGWQDSGEGTGRQLAEEGDPEKHNLPEAKKEGQTAEGLALRRRYRMRKVPDGKKAGRCRTEEPLRYRPV
ncbi:MAG: hypothetical protein SPF84_00070 [Lachnospiraceae bacterium]|nr:hypothetical protein [Oscillospiraceae bacterium]MDY5647142.1 hypothetical protein [Lachnospiraceae bacterium]